VFICNCTGTDDADSAAEDGTQSQSQSLADWLQTKLDSIISRLRGTTPLPDHHGDPELVADGNEEVDGDTAVPKPTKDGESGSDVKSEQVPSRPAARDVPKVVCYGQRLNMFL